MRPQEVQCAAVHCCWQQQAVSNINRAAIRHAKTLDQFQQMVMFTCNLMLMVMFTASQGTSVTHLVYCSSAESKTHVLRKPTMRCSQWQIDLGPWRRNTPTACRFHDCILNRSVKWPPPR